MSNSLTTPSLIPSLPPLLLRSRALRVLILVLSGLAMAVPLHGTRHAELLALLFFLGLHFAIQVLRLSPSEATTRQRWFSGMRRGAILGVVFFVGSLHWIIEVHPAGWVALSLYLTVFHALWGGFTTWALARRGLLSAAAVACSWVALELFRGWFLTGFGWNGVGVIVGIAELPIVQMAEWVGSTGLAFFIVFWFACWNAGSGHWRYVGTVLFLAANVAGMWLRQVADRQPVRQISCLIVQPNVAQKDRWAIQEEEMKLGQDSDPGRIEAFTEKVNALYTQLENLTLRNVNQGTDLVLWPESSLYYPFDTAQHMEFLDRILKAGKFSLVLGADVHKDGAFNSAVALRGSFEEQSIYRKIHLVPFGEFLPLRNIPLMESMLGGLVPGDFSRGTETEPIAFADQDWQILPSVCFEDTVGRLERKFVRPAAQVLVNITNDGWFGESVGPEQHFANARLRSIELRRPLVRCANTGVSGAVSHSGRVLYKMPPFTTSAGTAVVPVPTDGKLTLYARYGDWFSLLCSGFVLVYFFIRKKAASTSC